MAWNKAAPKKEKPKFDNKCSAHQMLKVIVRQVPINSEEFEPEHRLMLAVIGCAVSDLVDKTYQFGAAQFFKDRLFSAYCEFLGLNPAAIRELLAAGGFMKAAA